MTTDSTDTPDGVHSTGEFNGGAVQNPGVNVIDPVNANNDAFDVLFGDELEEWPEQASKKGFRAPWPVTVLVALILIVGGLALGAFLQRGRSTTSTSATTAGRTFGAGFAGATATGSSATSASATTSGTAGTVTDIIGKTLYVTSATGALVAVKVSSTTTIDRDASSSLSALKPGDTVTVQGTTEKNGSVEAATISATAKGVTPTGFGGGGAFAGRTGGTGAAAGG
jgi:hypothetical protein